jgi:hypothetical protein
MALDNKTVQEFNQLISDAREFLHSRRNSNPKINTGLVNESMGFTINEVLEINQFLKNENSRNT